MRGILDLMMKRLFAVAVALAVVSAPVALEACQITCESKGMPRTMAHAAGGHSGHHHMPADHASCHEHGDAPQQLSPVSGLCDHSTEATPSLVARNFDTAVSLLATVPSIDSIILAPTRDSVFLRESASADRLVIPLAIPLRV